MLANELSDGEGSVMKDENNSERRTESKLEEGSRVCRSLRSRSSRVNEEIVVFWSKKDKKQKKIQH